jgi:solute carrier family 50 protein (sugar transporter)
MSELGAVFGVKAAAVAAAFSPLVKPEAIGATAVLFCIALFASPLASLKTVIEEKSARSIPLPFTVMAVANCLFWSITGLAKLKDLNVIVPNILGLFFRIVQVRLKLIYGNGPSDNGNGYSLATPWVAKHHSLSSSTT